MHIFARNVIFLTVNEKMASVVILFIQKTAGKKAPWNFALNEKKNL